MKLCIALAIVFSPLLVILYAILTTPAEERGPKQTYTVWSVLAGVFALVVGLFYQAWTRRPNKFKDWE